jgi:glycosyltransferase involved in cell wall biosynthesis
MRILHVVPFFPPTHGFGVREVVHQLSRALIKRGHEVVIYTSDMKDLNSRLAVGQFVNIDGINVHYFRSLPIKRIERLYLTPGLIKKTRNDVKDFDVIHLHGFWSFQNIVLHHFARKNSIPYVLQAHGSLPGSNSHKVLKKLFNSLFGTKILEGASKLVAVSQTEVDQYLAQQIPMHRIATIPNGVDLSRLKSRKGVFRKKYSIDNNKRIILFIGRLHPMKGVDILIQAYARLVEEFDDILLVFVGPDDGCLDYLKNQVMLLGLSDRIVFTGPLYGQEKFDVYKDSDIFVLPSRYEIFGLVLIEASAFSLPIIASNLPSISEIIQDGRTGRLFTSGLVQSLIEKISEALQNPEKSRKMAENNRLVSEQRYDINQVAESVETLYLELIG